MRFLIKNTLLESLHQLTRIRDVLFFGVNPNKQHYWAPHLCVFNTYKLANI